MTTFGHFILCSIIGSIITGFIGNYLITDQFEQPLNNYAVIKMQRFIISIMIGFCIGSILSFVI